MLLLGSLWAGADFHEGRRRRRLSSRKDPCKRPLEQGNCNFDRARRGSYLHLVFGDRHGRAGVPSGWAGRDGMSRSRPTNPRPHA
jgi:hypothetical protein